MNLVLLPTFLFLLAPCTGSHIFGVLSIDSPTASLALAPSTTSLALIALGPFPASLALASLSSPLACLGGFLCVH